LTGKLLKIAYQLHYHRLGEWALDRWGITASLGLAVLILLQWWLRGKPPLPAWHWLVLALLILLGGGLLGLRWWGASRSFVVFVPQAGTPVPAGQPLDPTDKILLHATGQFEVAGKSHFFANLLAYWRTFATREHAVMAIAHESRFLWLGRMPEKDVGMWYIFFRPEAIQAITPGRLTFGSNQFPALRVAYEHIPSTPSNRKQAKPSEQTVFLAFDDDVARQRVWADLLADGSI